MGVRRRLPFGKVLAAVLAAAWIGGCSPEPPPQQPRQAPDFTLRDVHGNRVRRSEVRGQVVLLDFWATWCPPCRVAIPHLVELQETYRSEGLQVLGLSLDQNPDDLVSFLGSQPVNYPMLRVDDKTRFAYGGIPSVPEAFLIDRAGRIRKKYMGYSRQIAKEMEELIQTLLREPAPGS
ncbi:MAG: TlpA disulfide reductase family protein [Deferrisomatales bacterium]